MAITSSSSGNSSFYHHFTDLTALLSNSGYIFENFIIYTFSLSVTVFTSSKFHHQIVRKHLSDLFKTSDSGRVLRMRTNTFFHPHHVIPTIKFKTAFVKSSCRMISHMLVELYTVSCKIFIFRVRISDAGIEINHILKRKGMLQCRVKFFSKPMSSYVFCYVDRRFHRPIVSSPLLKRTCICIPGKPAVFL